MIRTLVIDTKNSEMSFDISYDTAIGLAEYLVNHIESGSKVIHVKLTGDVQVYRSDDENSHNG